MGYVYLTNLNSNAYFDQQGTTITLWNTQSQKQAFMDKLFENASPVEVFSNFPSDNGFRFSIVGNWRNYNYLKFVNGLNPEKYYFIRNVRTYYEANKEKTEITIDYDLINNSTLLCKDLKLNSANNNHLVFRSNLPNMTPTYHNLIRCSSICQNITSDIITPKENIYQLNNFFANTSPPVEEGNYGSLAVYIRFKSSFVPKQGLSAPQYFWKNFLNVFLKGMTYAVDPEINSITELCSYINYDNTDFVSFFIKNPNETSIGFKTFNINAFLQTVGQMTELSDYVSDIKFDWVDNAIFDEEHLFQVYNIVIDSQPAQPLFYVPRDKISTIDTSGQTIFRDINIGEIDNNFEKSHFVFAHLLPYFFSQKWPKKKFVSYFYEKYFISQLIGSDNTFPLIWGYTNDEVREFIETEIQSLSSSFTLLTNDNLTDNQIVSNSSQQTALSGVASLLGAIAGALLAPETGGASIAGGALFGNWISSYGRGIIGNQIKIRDQGVLHIGTSDTYKKYYNYNLPSVQPLAPRYSIDIWVNYFTEQQKEIIVNDREKYGNYLNEFFNTYDYESVSGYHYIESKWISFLVSGLDVNTQNHFINLCNRGVFINFNPEPFQTKTVSITSSTGDFDINPSTFTVRENDIINLQSTFEDLTFNPDNLIYTEADNIELGSSTNDLTITESE